MVEEKTLPKHLNTAVNAIQKQIDKYELEIARMNVRCIEIEGKMLERRKEIDGLKGQIAKLKGE